MTVSGREDVGTVPVGEPSDMLHPIPGEERTRFRDRVPDAENPLHVSAGFVALDAETSVIVFESVLVEEGPADAEADLSSLRSIWFMGVLLKSIASGEAAGSRRIVETDVREIPGMRSFLMVW